MSENSILKDLNKEQKEAVLNINGPLLIIAGAGSGKTKALTHRISYLIESGVRPNNIVALTFTNRAAEEMRERIFKLLNPKTPKLKKLGKNQLPFIGTFHSLGSRILRKKINLLGRDNNFLIYDEADRLSLIKEIIASNQNISDKIKPRAVKAAISAQKNELVSPQEFSQKADGFFEKIVSDIYIKYEQVLKELNAVDFDDLLIVPVKLFNEFPQALKSYQEQIAYILVDEYQDTNKAQYMFLKQLSGDKKNICVVGDDWQAIYGFRGADFRNILNFDKDYPNASVIFLEQNYRSTQNILDAAQAIIEKNSLRTNKKLWTQEPGGDKVNIIQVANEVSEANFITKEIEKLKKQKKLNSLKDVVVLYRTNAQSRVLEESFLENSLPYKIIGSVRFYDRKEIKDIIAYLRFIYNKKDILSLKRIANIPPRGIGKITLEKILSEEGRAKTRQSNMKVNSFLKTIGLLRKNSDKNNLSALIKNVLKQISYKSYINDGSSEGESRWENVQELIGVAKKFDHLIIKEALESFLEEVALLSPSDDISEKDNLVNLMTLHSVKGLEFQIVFIVGCEEGLLPHSRSILSSKDMEEERRLCYVGVTRAKKRIYFVFAKKRSIFGSTQNNIPSRFLEDIPSDIVDFQSYNEEDLNVLEI